jgi:molybdopterin-containing oxidoreductase family iron-sulfur binding subunit
MKVKGEASGVGGSERRGRRLRLRRGEFLRRAGLAAGAVAAGGLAGCSSDQVAAFLQKQFRQLTEEELRAVLKRLEREYEKKYGRSFEVRADPPMDDVLFGYGLDLSRCVGCRRCVHACVLENNCSRLPQVQWIRVLEMEKTKGVDLTEANHYYAAPRDRGAVGDGGEHEGGNEEDEKVGLSHDPADYALSPEELAILRDPDSQYPLYKHKAPWGAAGEVGSVPREGHFYMPVACQQCRRPQCVTVCPVKATWSEPDGIVVVDYNWCIGCRYCMAACPYGARHFNWGEPTIPPDQLNTETHYLGNRPRYRGHVEKCTFCIQRVRRGRYPACVEICPVGARKFGNLLDPESEIRYLLEHKRVYVFKEEINTQPKFYYFYGP